MLEYPLGVRRKIEAACKRWYKRLRLSEWDLRIYEVHPEQLVNCRDNDGEVLANYTALPQYGDGVIHFNEEMPPEDMEYVVFHEMRHFHYSKIALVFQQAWDGRSKMTREQMFGLLEDAIDKSIKEDWRIIGPLFEKNNGKS